MRHLTKDLVPCVEAKKRLLKPAELCDLWRNAPYRLAFNELTQEVELDVTAVVSDAQFAAMWPGVEAAAAVE